MIVNFVKSLIMDFWATVAEMSPYLLFGFFVAGALSVLVSQAFVEKHLGGRGVLPLLKASIFGVPLPLCSCGVIPVSMSLHKHGASKGSTIAFLLSTPQTGVDSIFVTYSLLGPVFAVFRPIAALITGIAGGTFVDIFEKTKNPEEHQREKCTDECCNGDKKNGKIIRGLKYGFITLPRDIGKPMLIGLFIAGVISAIRPDDLFAEKLLGTGFFAMVVMMLLGIPIYVCATASVPVAAALIMKGLTPGAALVFLMTGPATNAASFTTIWKVLGRRTAIIYLLTTMVCALAAGLLLDAILPDLGPSLRSHLHQMDTSLLGHISAIVLFAVIGYALFGRAKHGPSGDNHSTR
ncbi:MAG: SO_0444 family Cu/Zn efflux transporter [Sedimentisphaerales bacterium]|nr:SO_0444 family Cu/Zn efflux transporter [Sedimentisphaerales bacterium]